LNLITNILKWWWVNRFVWSYSIDKNLSCRNILASFVLILLCPCMWNLILSGWLFSAADIDFLLHSYQMGINGFGLFVSIRQHVHVKINNITLFQFLTELNKLLSLVLNLQILDYLVLNFALLGFYLLELIFNIVHIVKKFVTQLILLMLSLCLQCICCFHIQITYWFKFRNVNFIKFNVI